MNTAHNVSLFQIGSRSSVYSPESSVRKTGSYIYEEFMPTDGTDVKVLNKLASSLPRDCITLFLLIYIELSFVFSSIVNLLFLVVQQHFSDRLVS